MQVLRFNDCQSEFVNGTIIAFLLLIVTGGCSQFQTANFDDFIDQQPSRTQLEGTTIGKAELERLTNERISLNRSKLNESEFDVDPNLISNLPSQVLRGQTVDPSAFPRPQDQWRNDQRNNQPNNQGSGSQSRDVAGNTINVDPSVFERTPNQINNRLSPLQPSRPNQPLVAGPKPVDFDRGNDHAAKQPYQLVTNQDAFRSSPQAFCRPEPLRNRHYTERL